MKELKYYANLAQKILETRTKYLEDKKLISSFFQNKEFPAHKALYRLKRIIGKLFKERTPIIRTIILRLTIIDSYYSTQMSKRLFGIEEIAGRIKSISDDDYILSRIFLEFVENPKSHSDIDDLFIANYGIHKTGEKAGKAQSLISKYAYFLTNYRFPIYDSLVQYSYNLIKHIYPGLGLSNLARDFSVDYFQKINFLNRKSKINDFDKLDNLLWLAGKYIKGSFSLIISCKKYKALVNNIMFPRNVDSEQPDEIIRSFIKENTNSNKLKRVFSKEEIEFIKFCFSNT